MNILTISTIAPFLEDSNRIKLKYPEYSRTGLTYTINVNPGLTAYNYEKYLTHFITISYFSEGDDPKTQIGVIKEAILELLRYNLLNIQEWMLTDTLIEDDYYYRIPTMLDIIAQAILKLRSTIHSPQPIISEAELKEFIEQNYNPVIKTYNINKPDNIFDDKDYLSIDDSLINWIYNKELVKEINILHKIYYNYITFMV